MDKWFFIYCFIGPIYQRNIVRWNNFEDRFSRVFVIFWKDNMEVDIICLVSEWMAEVSVLGLTPSHWVVSSSWGRSVFWYFDPMKTKQYLVSTSRSDCPVRRRHTPEEHKSQRISYHIISRNQKMRFVVINRELFRKDFMDVYWIWTCNCHSL